MKTLIMRIQTGNRKLPSIAVTPLMTIMTCKEKYLTAWVSFMKKTPTFIDHLKR